MKKLLLFGNNCVHTYNYYQLIKDYFDEILLVVDSADGVCAELPIRVLNYSINPIHIIKSYIATQQIIKDFNPTVIHGQQINKAIFYVTLNKRKHKIPLVVTAWGSDVLLIPQQNRLYKKIVQYVLCKADYLTSDSRFTAYKMQQLVDKKLNITIANFGVDVCNPMEKKQNVIYSNRLHKSMYHIDAVIRSFSKFVVTHPDWKLIIGAVGEETERLKHLVNTLNLASKVKFVGWLDKERNFYYYSIAKFWVSIPSSDATSISLLEAMSMNCIPIVSNLSANREWITDGENGYIVKDVNEDFLSKALKIPVEQATRMNRQIIMEQATKAINKQKFTSIYDTIIASKTKLRILLINHYAGSPEMGMEFRPYYMAREWQKAGHQVVVVGGTYSHLRVKQPKQAGWQELDGVRYYWLKTNRYHGNGMKRAFSMFLFVCRLLFSYRKICKDFVPDVVIASSTYPLDNYPAWRIARRYGAKYVYEIHDLWPLSPMQIGGMSAFHPFIKVMQWAEKFAYRYCDKCISILPKTDTHAIEHGLQPQKFFCVQNGIALSDWNDSQPIDNEYTKFFKKLKSNYRFIIGYVGGHALSNSLDILLDAAKQVARENIAVVLVGEGAEKARLMKRCTDENITNLYFLNAVAKKQVPELLSQMDALYIGWTKNPLYKYGISPNKIFDYAMAGKPIVHAVDAGNDLVQEAQCGISVPSDDVGKIAEAIITVAAMSADERAQLGKNGHEYVLKHHTYDVLAKQFIDILEK
jgi:glycosyltransferase involved in cell wall biosynthesis